MIDRARPSPTVALRGLLLVAAAIAPTSPLVAQSYWELSPYSIKVLVATRSGPELTDARAAGLREALAERAAAAIGAPWDLQVEPADATFARAAFGSGDPPDAESLPDEWRDLDKLFLVGVTHDRLGFRIAARELDLATRTWGHARVLRARQTGRLEAVAFEAVLEAFAPLGRVTGADAESAVVRLRAAALPSRDPAWPYVEPGEVFRPIVRRNDRDGRPRPGGIVPVAWTYLVAEEEEASSVRCRIVSGMRNALAVRRRGRVDLLALAVRPGIGPTELVLHSRTDPPSPLAGYDVYLRTGGAPRRLGRTDATGELRIADETSQLLELVVKHGGELLARLPIVPGLLPREIARLVDDDPRLRIEGQLAGVRENLVDVVARRQVLLARARAALEGGQVDLAVRLHEELKRLPTREDFALRVAQIEKQADPADPTQQKRIERMISETRRLLAGHLDRAPIDKMQSQLDAARKQGSP